jgi:hypothetical protein
LRGRAARGEIVPALAMEQLLVLLVGELGLGDVEAPVEVAAAGFGEAAVGLGVDAGDEEAGDEVIRIGPPPEATSRSSPRRYASTASRWRVSEKIKVTLIAYPRARSFPRSPARWHRWPGS